MFLMILIENQFTVRVAPTEPHWSPTCDSSILMWRNQTEHEMMVHDMGTLLDNSTVTMNQLGAANPSFSIFVSLNKILYGMVMRVRGPDGNEHVIRIEGVERGWIRPLVTFNWRTVVRS